MTDELKIIFSMYNRLTGDVCGKITDCRFTMCLDKTEVLLMLEKVFEERKYKFVRTGTEAYITNCSDENVFSGIICCTKDLEFIKGKELISLKQFEYGKDDYKLIEKKEGHFLSEVRRNLLYGNFLVECINMRSVYMDRDAELYFGLFDLQRGKSLIDNMFSGIMWIVNSYLAQGSDGVKGVLDQINHRFAQMEDLFEKRMEIAGQMEWRETEAEKTFDTHVFQSEINEFLIEIERIKESASQTRTDFIFYYNLVNKKYACYLLDYIEKLYHIFTGENARLSFRIDNMEKYSSPIFFHMDHCLEELEGQIKEKCLFAKWYSDFCFRLYEVWGRIDIKMVQVS